jgi:hypothetical protein
MKDLSSNMRKSLAREGWRGVAVIKSSEKDVLIEASRDHRQWRGWWRDNTSIDDIKWFDEQVDGWPAAVGG